MALTVLALAQLDSSLEETIVSPALPALERHYLASPTAAAWLLTGFLLAAAVSTPLAGRLGDQFGHRRVFILSLSAFAAGSLVCLLGHTIGVAIAGRVIQGFGAGMGPLSLALARGHVKPGRVPAAVGLLVATGGVGVVVGLLIVGPLVDDISITAVFWLLLAVPIVLMVAARWTLAEQVERSRRPIDFPGALLLAAAVGSVMLAVSRASTWGWGSTRTLGLFAVALVAMAAFSVRERTAAEPFLDRATLKMRSVWSANLAIFAVGFSLFISFTLEPLIAGYPKLTHYGLGLTTGQIGVMLVPNSLSLIIGALLGARMIGRTGARPQAILGTFLGVVTYLGLALFHHPTETTLALLPIPLGFGVGLALGAIKDLILLSTGPRDIAGTLALNDVIQSFASALGAQIAVVVLTAAPLDALGLPVRAGFTHAFLLAAAAAAVAVLAVLCIPRRAADPTVSTVAGGVAASGPRLRPGRGAADQAPPNPA
jgi:MFS family permease